MRLLPALVNVTVGRQATSATVYPLRNFLEVNRGVRSLTTIHSVLHRSFLGKEHRQHSPARKGSAIRVLRRVGRSITFRPPRFQFPVLFRMLKGPRSNVVLGLVIHVNRQRVRRLHRFLTSADLTHPRRTSSRNSEPARAAREQVASCTRTVERHATQHCT